MKKSAAFCFALCVLAGGCLWGGPARLSSEMVVSRSQPAVFKIFAFGDINITCPSKAETKKITVESTPDIGLITSLSDLFQPQRALVRNEYRRDREAGVIESTTTETEYCWEKVADSPDKYLRMSADRSSGGLKNVPYQTGSGFAVSREGIILTNAHVIAAPTQEILGEPGTALALLELPIRRTLFDLANEFGGDFPQAVSKKLVLGLAEFLSKQTTLTSDSKFNEARIAVNAQGDKPLLDSSMLKALGLDVETDPFEKLRNQTTRAEVVAAGQPYPGKDVAVLKVSVGDKLICLPLGESKDVSAGRIVQALGFPGAALNADQSEEAQFRVISHNGQVDQRLPMKNGWEAFHLTAEINHGDSGGPVVDEYGNVIALNVGGNPNAPAQNIAVPIDIAKELLLEAKIKLDIGPLTGHWLRGQDAFWRGNHKGALEEFENVAKLQNFRPLGLLPAELSNDTNPYVSDIISKCRESLKR